MVFWQMKMASGGKNPSERKLAEEAGVGKTFARKIIDEIKETGGIVPVEDLKEERWERKEKGVGCICLTLFEQQLLLDLRKEDPTRANEYYIASIYQTTGNIISSAFITSFFKKVGPYKGNFRKLPKVPLDKYKPSNIQTYSDYLFYISTIPPHLINFGDEKSLKG